MNNMKYLTEDKLNNIIADMNQTIAKIYELSTPISKEVFVRDYLYHIIDKWREEIKMAIENE